MKWNCIFEHVFEYFVWSLVSSVFCVCLQPGKKRLHVDQHHPNHHHQAPLFKIHLWFGPYIHDTYIHICISTCEKGSTGHLKQDQKKPMKKNKFFPVFIHFTCDLFDYWDCYPRASSLAYLFSLRKAMHKGSKEKKIVGAPKSTKKHKTKRMISLVTWCDDYSKYDRSHFIG